jgi:hypothetical protein
MYLYLKKHFQPSKNKLSNMRFKANLSKMQFKTNISNMPFKNETKLAIASSNYSKKRAPQLYITL